MVLKVRKILIVMICCLSVILCSLTGTIAWLMSESGPITNTFTPSNVKVELIESETTVENGVISKDFKMIPGMTYAKDPVIKVTTDIPCYVFVKVNEDLGAWENMGKTYAECFTYSVITGENEWKELSDGVYYRLVSSDDSFNVLTGDNTYTNGKITVNGAAVTMEMMNKLYETNAEMPTLTFTAYAIQQYGFDTPAAAWAEFCNPPASNS